MTNVWAYGPGVSWAWNQVAKLTTFVGVIRTLRPFSQFWLPGRSPAWRIAHWTSSAGASASRMAAGSPAWVGAARFGFGGRWNEQPARARPAAASAATARAVTAWRPCRGRATTTPGITGLAITYLPATNTAA